MWILILTLTINTSTGAAASISQVPDFSAEASCNSAGKAWLNSIKDRQASATAVCVCRHLSCNEKALPLR